MSARDGHNVSAVTLTLPESAARLTFHGTGGARPFPPLGFEAVAEGELGNGDHFGLYWAFGRETEPPMVCELIHDGWLEPAFSSADRFARWTLANDGEWNDERPEDPELCTTLHARARQALGSGDVDGAIALLRASVAAFGEWSEPWFLLADQLRRVGDGDGFERCTLEAVRANWAFGPPPTGALRCLRRVRRDGPLGDDPLVSHAPALSLRFGGVKENPDYACLRDCVSRYRSRGDAPAAARMLQNYGLELSRETTAFQAREGFDQARWAAELTELCESAFGSTRTLAGASR
ncbi:MAG: hypothetical protein AAGH15_27340 [Myxococcota bacterium]